MGIICKEKKKKVDLGLTGNYSSRLSFFGGGGGGWGWLHFIQIRTIKATTFFA